MAKEISNHGGKAPEQIRQDLQESLVPIVGSQELAQKWVRIIITLAEESGEKAFVIHPRTGEEPVVRVVFRENNGKNNVLLTFRTLS